jgi:hypothetical protein
MAFKGPNQIRNKIVINKEILEQVSNFKYLANTIYTQNKLGINYKLNNFNKITGITES